MHHITSIIVNWNGKKDTLVCLSSLTKIKIPGDVTHETIVVDNGSSDGSVALIKNKFPTVHVIALTRNEGFTGGNNIGMQKALKMKSDIVWLLNNDTYVDPGVLDCTRVFGNPKTGIAGSKIYFAPGNEYHRDRYNKDEVGKVFWYAGGLIDWHNMYASHRGVDEVDHHQYDAVTQTEFVTGCSMFIRAGVIEKIGFFDEKYYLYLEDLDYSLRAKRAGYDLLYVPSSVVWHKNAGSSGGSGSRLQEYYQTRNRLIIGLRYAPVRTKVALLRESIRMGIGGNTYQKKAVLDFFSGKFGRRDIQ